MRGIGIGMRPRHRRASAAWSPIALSPLLWLRADLGITLRDDAYVTAWADQSGNGHDFTQATEDDQPTLTSAEIIYDSTDTRLVSTEAASVWTFLHEGPATVALRARLTGTAQTANLASTQRGSVGQHGFHLQRNSTDSLVFQVTNGTAAVVSATSTAGTFAEGDDSLLIVRLGPGEPEEYSARWLGASILTGALLDTPSSSAPLGTLTIGDLTAGTLTAWDGAINHVLAWDRYLSLAECEQLEAHL